MERGVVAPPAPPTVFWPWAGCGAELVAPHDLGPDAGSPGRRDRLVEAELAVGLQAPPDPDLAEPVQELLVGVPEGGVKALALAAGVAVERHHEVVHAYLRHLSISS